VYDAGDAFAGVRPRSRREGRKKRAPAERRTEAQGHGGRTTMIGEAIALAPTRLLRP
jgi:hypothetical protein